MATYKPTFDGLSPQQVSSRRKVAEALTREGMSTEPVQHWTQALARVAQSGVGGFQMGSANAQENEGRRDVNMRLTQALTNKAPLKDTATSLMANPWSEETGQNLAVSAMKQDAEDNSATKAYSTRATMAEQNGVARGTPEWKRFVLTGKWSDGDSPTGTDDIKEFQFAQQNGFQGGFMDYLTSKKGGASAKTPEERALLATSMGIPADSPVYKRFVMTGQIDPKGMTATDQKSNVANHISGGLNQLAKIPDEFGGGKFSNAFESAIGSVRGQEDNGGWLPTMSDVGKVWGSITNVAGDRTTSEVRNRIKGDTEALAAAIKPLIRAPGEGAWTDQDQARLVSVVGNLALANNREEYERALEGTRSRIMSNFGIELPALSNKKVQGSLNGPSPSAIQALQANPDKAAEFDAKYGPGSAAKVLGGQ